MYVYPNTQSMPIYRAYIDQEPWYLQIINFYSKHSKFTAHAKHFKNMGYFSIWAKIVSLPPYFIRIMFVLIKCHIGNSLIACVKIKALRLFVVWVYS